MNIRIGYEHTDSLITYPDAPILSGCTVAIQMHGPYPDATLQVHQPPGPRRLASRKSTGRTSPHRSHPSHAITRIGYEHPDSYPGARFLSRCTDPIWKQHHGHPPGPLVPNDLHPATAPPGPDSGAHPRRHARLAQRHLAQPAARRQHTYKTRPDHPVRARNVFGSGVRTLAVVRAVLTTIATLTTPLRHVILLGFVV